MAMKQTYSETINNQTTAASGHSIINKIKLIAWASDTPLQTVEQQNAADTAEIRFQQDDVKNIDHQLFTYADAKKFNNDCLSIYGINH